MAAPLIMIVDDDPDYRAAVEELLCDAGYPVIVAANGRDVLDYLRAGIRPRLILLDLWMPRMDGWQLRRELQRHGELRKIPIVVLTGADPPSSAVLGVCAVLPKARTREIVATVAQQLAYA